MNKNYIFGIGIVLVVLLTLAAITAPAMARTDDIVFYLNTSDGSHEVSVAPGENVTIYLDADAPVNKTGGWEVAVMFDPDVLECLGVTENTSVTNWQLWTFRGVWNTTVDPDNLHYINFDALNFEDHPGPGLLRCGDMRVRGLNPGVTTLYLGRYPGDVTDINNKTSIGDSVYDEKNWTLFEPFTFTCVGPTYTISGYTAPAADTVKITNLNKPEVVKDRPADYIGTDGFYNLTLNVPGEVEAGNELQIAACDEIASDEYRNESYCNVSDHEVVNAPGEDTNVNLTLDHYCLHYHSYPYRTWKQTNWSGPAVMQMMVDHYRPEEPTQSDLNETGIAHNQQPCNADLSYVDPLGMRWTLNNILHNTSSYGGGRYANYGIGSYDNLEGALHYICYWQHAGPGGAPTYSDYSNWMAIRGIHTSENPYPHSAGSYDIYGFWMNDPNPTGIGENSYKTVDQWTGEYYFNLSGVRDCDNYKNRYVAVCEPPEQPDVEVTVVHSLARLEAPVKPELMGLDVVKAAIDGVNEELVPHDAEFAETFAKTVAGEPMLVTDDDGNDYYIVPFDVPVEKIKPALKKPVEIQKVEGTAVKLLSLADGKVQIEAVSLVEPVRIDAKGTLVVVLVDAEDGRFKEASWVADPVKYLPVSKAEALKLVSEKIGIPKAKPVIELVHRDASPYYPDWKITIGDDVYFVSQDGSVTSNMPLPKPAPVKPNAGSDKAYASAREVKETGEV